MNKEDDLKQVLHRNGFSMTKARSEVFKALRAYGPCQIHVLQNKLKPAVHRASLYRVIALFESLGVVNRIPYGWKYKLELSDMFTDHHHHAHCTECNTILKLDENEDVEGMIEQLATDSELQLTSHSLEIHGICKDCQSGKK